MNNRSVKKPKGQQFFDKLVKVFPDAAIRLDCPELFDDDHMYRLYFNGEIILFQEDKFDNILRILISRQAIYE